MSRKLLGTEKNGHRTDKYWLHDDHLITVETVENVEPAFKQAKVHGQNRNLKSDFRHKASIPFTVVDEICKINAKQWGIRPSEVMSELIANRTDRANKVWKMLTEARDFNKLHSKTY